MPITVYGPIVTAAGSSYTRTTVAITSSSLAPAAQQQATIALPAGYRLYKIVTTKPARVRLYTTAAKQAADLSRGLAGVPSGDHGLVFEFQSSSSLLSADILPMVDGVDLSTTPSGAVPITIDNLDSSTGATTVTFTYVRTE